MRLLLVEDDPVIGDALQRSLSLSGYAVDLLRDGQQADTALAVEEFDLVVLDLGLPRLDGLAVLRRLRQRHNRVPVLILSARDSLQDKIDGLDAGADDFLVKPFELVELEARLRALLRRGQGERIEFGACRWEIKDRKLYLHEQPVGLSARETALLELLLHNRNRVVSKDRILDTLTGWSGEIGTNAVEVYVHRLRRKLEPGNVTIRTVRGLGYLLEGGSAA